MKIGGMGEEALRIEAHELRRINEIPADVEIVQILPELPPHSKCVYVDGGIGIGPAPVEVWQRKLPQEWVPNPIAPPPVQPRGLYIHIKHRYCLRVPAGASLTYDSLDRFLIRFHSIREDEEARRGEKIGSALSYTCWVNDDA